MKKIKVKVIKIERVEGEAPLLPNKSTFTTWKDANHYLSMAALYAPDEGYHKCYFSIEWENGDTYKGRFDLQYRHFLTYQLLEKQIERFFRYLIENDASKKEEAQHFLEQMLIGDGEDE